jgi:hypothetical protein
MPLTHTALLPDQQTILEPRPQQRQSKPTSAVRWKHNPANDQRPQNPLQAQQAKNQQAARSQNNPHPPAPNAEASYESQPQIVVANSKKTLRKTRTQLPVDMRLQPRRLPISPQSPQSLRHMPIRLRQPRINMPHHPRPIDHKRNPARQNPKPLRHPKQLPHPTTPIAQQQKRQPKLSRKRPMRRNRIVADPENHRTSPLKLRETIAKRASLFSANRRIVLRIKINHHRILPAILTQPHRLPASIRKFKVGSGRSRLKRRHSRSIERGAPAP